MGRQQEGGGEKQSSSTASLRSKAAHLVSDLTTVLLNPISDKPSKLAPPPSLSPSHDDVSKQRRSPLESISEERDLVDGPDTSSFTAFLYSLLSPEESASNSSLEGLNENQVAGESAPEVMLKENTGKKSLLSRGKQSLGRAFYQAARFGGYRNQASTKGNSELKNDEGNDSRGDRNEGIPMQTFNEPVPLEKLPEISEPSLLLSESTRGSLYVALPALAQGRKWVLLYSTWRNGISLSTLYRRSMFCPGLSLLVVGDRKGAVFGGLVEAPLRPTSKKRYQGTNNTFLFTNTNTPGRPVVYHPTGVNRYFTLCQTEYLALGGGSHFALYLDGDLLNGSSSASETYGNCCLARTQEFEVKEIELWGFVYASKYEEMISILRTEAPGICRW